MLSSQVELDPAGLFAFAFGAALVAGCAVKLWLALRQARHLRRHRDSVPAAFSASVELSAHQSAVDYTQAKLQLAYLQIIASSVLVAAFTLGGGLNALDQWLFGYTESRDLLHGLLLLVGFAAVGAGVDLVFDLVRTFVIEQRYGFNVTRWPRYLADLLLSTGLSLAIGLPLFAAALWLIASFGAWWWLLAWLGLLLVAALAMIVGPRWIAPLFNKFQSLQDQVLQQRIDGLLKRCGFQTGGVFVMDASRRSNHGNAYFTGLGSAKRVVLFDTLLRQLAADEIEAVLAHELGHFKLRHIGKRLGLMALVSGLAVFTLALLMQQPWFFAGLGVSALAASNAMALLLFSLVLPVFGFFLSPLFSAYSRKHEFEADRFASQQADPTALVAALVKLFRDNSSPLTQDPIYAAVYSSHPSAGERIARIGGGA